MMIDCDSCTVRGAACTDCVVTFLTIPVRPSTSADGAPAAGAVAGGVEAAPVARRADRTGGGGAPPAAARTPPRGGTVDLDDDERAAIDVLAMSGLVPPLRMVRAV